MAKKKAQLDYAQFATDYGFQLSFLKSDPELYNVFKQAVDNTWDTSKFQNAIRNTKWYKTHGEAYRQTLALRTTDPATYKTRVAALQAEIGDKARAMGANFTNGQLLALATKSLEFGWNENQLNNAMSSYVRYYNARGQAGANLQQMQQVAWKNGIRTNGHAQNSWLQAIARGDLTMDDYTKWVRNQAATLAPAYADQIKAGVDLYDVAQPYMQSMAQTFEMNPADIDLFDPTIRQALSTKDKEGKPTSMSLSDFEISLRNDKRYMKTQQAQDSVMSVGHKVLQDMGLLS